MKLSPWFHVGKYGAPVNLGWYDFERRAKGRDAALSRRVPLERRVGRQNVTTE